MTRKTEASLIIHGFATAHGAVALALANTVVGDTAVLTALTVTMITQLARLFDLRFDRSASVALLAQTVSQVGGVYLLSRLVSWMPGLGNWLNASVAFGLTQAIGWTAYHFFEAGARSGDLRITREKVRAARRDARREPLQRQDALEQLAAADRRQYHSLEGRLRNLSLSNEERAAVVQEMIDLLRRAEEGGKPSQVDCGKSME